MGDLNVTLHHDGVFVPNPLKYACGSLKILNEIRFEEMQIGIMYELLTELVLSNAIITLYYCLPDTTLTRGIRELKTDSDMAEFMRIGYENNKQMELFTEHYGYDVLEYTANDNLVANNISDYEESDVSDYDGESDPENVDFHTEGEHGVHFERLSIDDAFLTKLVGNGNFIEEDDPEVDIIDPIYKVVKLCVAHGYKLWYYRNDSESLLVYCGRDTSIGRWIAKHYAKEIILNPSIPIRSMQNDIREKFLINVSTGQCKRAKQFALYEHERGLIEHYSKFWEYRNAVIESNPGSTCHIDQVVDDDGQIHFSRLYVCYKGLKDGWIAGCRRVIGIDGCFLTHHSKGELLSAIGRDANNQMFPIAWAVVRVENKNNWCWFLSLLSDDLGLQDGLGITVISDAHKGLEEAVKTWLPQAEHRHSASSTVEQEFLSKMEDIRRFDPEAHAYLMKKEPASWCKAFLQPVVKCVAFENGIFGSFNGKIVTARGKPIITMLEDIRVYVCPSGYQVLEVRKRDEAYGVNLIERSCFCKLWDLSGIPCVHVVAAYMHLHMDPELGVCDWYTQSKWHDAYQFSIKPVFGSKMWKASPNTPPLPPIIQKMPGRPRKKRVRHPTENDYEVSKVGRQMTCQLCYKTGHNKQTCTAKKQPKPQKSGKPPKPPSYKKFSKHVKGGGSVVRGGGSNIGRGGGNVGRGGGSSNKRGGGSVGRGGGSS
ncbi:hypothetical protein Tco_0746334, partial [Tanacetum coccineum]